MKPAAGWRDGAWRDWAWRFVLHVATGVLAVAVHYALMALAMTAGLRPVAASALGFVGGAVTRFYTAYFHVYAPSGSVRAALPRFLLALAAQFVANALLLQALLAFGWPVWWAQAATTVALTFAAYLAFRLLVFN
ncbi:MAG: GtrA family protein [Proteobacteria bacterium]|nr:GtrA family protein [Pseudomonadota bacterium]